MPLRHLPTRAVRLFQIERLTRIKRNSYTDTTITFEVNKLLSEPRDYGPRYGITSNTPEAGRAKNRCLSIKVL